MTSIPEQRREQILTWLKDDQLLRIDDLAQRLDVSHMTVHRDLDALVEMGLVEKVHGAVRLPDPHKVTTDTCHLCKMPVKPRLQFVITNQSGQTLRACCPHCGIMLLALQSDVAMALLRDFIYGRIVNVRQAYFVVESRVALCCEPSVIAFATQQDAHDFQQGFGGRVLDFAQARAMAEGIGSDYRRAEALIALSLALAQAGEYSEARAGQPLTGCPFSAR